MTPDFNTRWRYVQLPDPSTEPTATPYVTLACSVAWLPYIIGTLLDLLRQSAWDAATVTDANNLVDTATNLIGMIGVAANNPNTLAPLSNGSPTAPFISNGAGSLVVN